jgi:hypothetical protein
MQLRREGPAAAERNTRVAQFGTGLLWHKRKR